MMIFFVPSPTWFVKPNVFASPSLLSANREMKDTHYLEYAMGAGVLALIGFELSPDFPYCDEDSLFQFHAMWHLMSAVAMLFMGLYLYEGHGIDFSDDYFEV